MRKKISESYANRVFLIFMIFSLALFLLSSIINGVTTYQLYNSSIREQGKTSVENISTTLTSMLDNYTTAMESMYQENSMQLYFSGMLNDDIQLEVMKRLYYMKNSSTEKASISVVELRHNNVISTEAENEHIWGMVYSNWGIFRKANSSEKVEVYAFAKDAVLNNEDRICLAKACRGENKEILGYILVEISRSSIEKLVTEYRSDYNTDFMLVNKNGSVVYHSRGVEQEGLGKIEQYGEMEVLQENIQGEVTWKNYVSCFNPRAGVYIIKELPQNAMSTILTTIFKTTLVSVALIFLLGIAFSKIVSKSVAKPVQELKEKMSKMKHGDLSVRVQVTRQDEIGQLGDSFNAMADRIEELIENIDEKKHSLWVAETQSLNLQMNPHFLYNTLDLIKWNARLGRNQEISDITVNLGKLLRKVMNTKDDLVTISYEMEIVTAFVEIQKKHYGDQLRLITEIEHGAQEELIPKLTLQPMIENAIVHGFREKTNNCEIKVKVFMENNYLFLEVEDNGAGMTDEELEGSLEFKQDNTHHIGLSNVQRRARLYGDESCGLTLSSQRGIGTQALLKLKRMNKGII